MRAGTHGQERRPVRAEPEPAGAAAGGEARPRRVSRHPLRSIERHVPLRGPDPPLLARLPRPTHCRPLGCGRRSGGSRRRRSGRRFRLKLVLGRRGGRFGFRLIRDGLRFSAPAGRRGRFGFGLGSDGLRFRFGLRFGFGLRLGFGLRRGLGLGTVRAPARARAGRPARVRVRRDGLRRGVRFGLGFGSATGSARAPARARAVATGLGSGSSATGSGSGSGSGSRSGGSGGGLGFGLGDELGLRFAFRRRRGLGRRWGRGCGCGGSDDRGVRDRLRALGGGLAACGPAAPLHRAGGQADREGERDPGHQGGNRQSVRGPEVRRRRVGRARSGQRHHDRHREEIRPALSQVIDGGPPKARHA